MISAIATGWSLASGPIGSNALAPASCGASATSRPSATMTSAKGRWDLPSRVSLTMAPMRTTLRSPSVSHRGSERIGFAGSAAALLVAALLVLAANIAHAAAEPRFLVLCYHNIEDTNPDQTYVGVTTAKFVAQLSWLQRNGYSFLSIDDLLAARDGRKPLPEKAVLLTFDDGYESFYTRAFPILKAFHAPAVLGLVGAWMAEKPGATVTYGDTPVPRALFMSWNEVRE